MRSDTFHFRVGDFACIVFRDKAPLYPIQMFLTNLGPDLYEPWMQQRGQDPLRTEIPYLCLLIDTGRERVLVDTGIGVSASSPGELIPLLQKEGIACGDISIVFLTHGHGDHVNGCLDQAGKPAFPNARYLIGQREHDFWMSSPSLDGTPIRADYRRSMVENAQKNISGVHEQLDLIGPETEIARGLRTLAAYGHTPGQLGLEIASASNRLLFVADAIIHPLHLRYPKAISAVDYDPVEVFKTRARLLEKAATANCLVGASHLPFPGLGYVAPERSCWEWRPIS